VTGRTSGVEYIVAFDCCKGLERESSFVILWIEIEGVFDLWIYYLMVVDGDEEIELLLFVLGMNLEDEDGRRW